MKEENFFKAVRIRLYPSNAQLVLLEKNAGCVRFVYNKALATKIRFWENSQTVLSSVDLINGLPSLKEKYPWLKEVDSQSLQQAIRDMDVAYNRFFKGASKHPTFKRKTATRQSFRLTSASIIRVDGNSIKLGKLGMFNFRGNADLLQSKALRNITVSKESGKWYASCLVQYQPDPHVHQYQESVGVDLGVAIPLAVAGQGSELKSIGKSFARALEKKECRRKHYQRNLSRKQKGSKNRSKARLHLNAAYWRERQFRKEFVEQTSHSLTWNFQTLVFEDLNVSGMTKQVRKTVDGSPRKNVSAKAGLNRSLLRLGLSMLVTRCQQKARDRGGQVVLVDPRFTSQTCSDCGSVDKSSRESQARFRCVHCGFTLNADYNAARNILAKGLSLA